MIVHLLFLLILLSTCHGYTVRHTVWLPAGKLIQLPCKIREPEATESPLDWVARNGNLNMEFAANSAVGWYDRLGRLIHVGEILSLQAPHFESTELSATQLVPREASPKEAPVNAAPSYRSYIGGTSHVLHAKHLDTITCTELQASTVVGVQDPWKQYDRQTHIRKQVFFRFHIYVQPTIVWTYAIPPDASLQNQTLLLRAIERWCHHQRSIRLHRGHLCSHVYEQHRPLIRLRRSTDDVPMVLSTETGYTEIGIAVELASNVLYLLADPTQAESRYFHAKFKNDLDKFILSELTSQAGTEGDIMTVATRIQAVCPPGTQTNTPIPALTNLNLDPVNETLDNSSAAPLTTFQLLCYPCADGYAPRSPYAFDRCYPCPRGYYLGSTGWPSGAGCLPCPHGFTTDSVGSTSVKACKLNAGAVTRWALSGLLERWMEVEKLIVGDAAGTDAAETRSLGQEQQSAWAWLGQTRLSLWLWGTLYLAITFWMIAMACYRLHLYYRLQHVLKQQYAVLLKAALIGQINLVSHIKQRAKQPNELRSP